MRVGSPRHSNYYRLRLLHRAIFFVGILTLWIFNVRPAFAFFAQKDTGPAIQKLEAYITENVQKRRIPGCAVAIVYKNQIIYMKGFGVKTIGTNDKINADTVFQLGSVSKPVAATLATILENKGFIRMDDPVTRYLPNFSLNTSQPTNAFKIKHVLSHSSGISRSGFNNLIESFAPYDKILHSLQRTPVRAQFGKHYDYHNAMFSLISEITEAASGQSFSHSLHSNLLQPLNMNRTSATLYGLLSTPNRASPHIHQKRGLVPCDTYSKGYYNVAPAGGINSSVRDMANFLKAQLGGYPQVLNHRVLNRLQTPQIATKALLRACDGPPSLIKNGHYALGWRVVDFDHHKLIYHGGMLKGFTNFIALMPQHQIGIVILHNSNTRFTSQAGVKFFEAFLDVPIHHHTQSAKPKLTKKPKGQKNVTFIKNKKLRNAQKINCKKEIKGQRVPIQSFEAIQTIRKVQKVQNPQALKPKNQKAQKGQKIQQPLKNQKALNLPCPPTVKKAEKIILPKKPQKTVKLQNSVPKLPKAVKEIMRNPNKPTVKKEIKKTK